MKKTLLLAFLAMIGLNLFSQTDQGGQLTLNDEGEKRNCITIGFLQGGGSLVGADFEIMATDNFGIQVGAGFVGLGAGINYHFKPSVRSSFLSLQYWHQGMNDSFSQDMIGPTFVYRGNKWFTAQLGIGSALRQGPAWPETIEQAPVMLLYSIGFYLPI